MRKLKRGTVMGNKIEIENLKKSFKNQVVLRNVSVDFEAGKFMELLAETVLGKQYCLKYLQGF